MAVEKISHQWRQDFIGALSMTNARAARPLMLMAPNWLGVTDEA